MKVLLDTNICIYMIKKKPPQVLDQIKKYTIGDVGVSAITVAELYYGVQKSKYQDKNRRALLQFLSPFVIAGFDYEASLTYRQIRASLEKRGEPIGSLDMLIAAHALSLDVTLITNNKREFSRVERLRIEDWTSS